MTDLPRIGMLWMEGRLSYLEQLCIISFRDAGHQVVLYHYGPLENVPDGIELADAATIMPRGEEDLVYKRMGSPALHADRFRYRMLAAEPGMIWADTDAYCVKPFTTETGHFHGWESSHRVNNGVLGLPPDSATLKALLAFTEDVHAIPPWFPEEQQAEYRAKAEAGDPVHAGDMTWGVWGPQAITHFLHATGEIAHSFPRHILYPFEFSERRFMLRRGIEIDDYVKPDTLSIHFYGRRMRKRLLEAEGGFPKRWSLIGKLLHQHNLDPEQAPLPEPKTMAVADDDEDETPFDTDEVAIDPDAVEEPADDPGQTGAQVHVFQTTTKDTAEFRTWFRGEHTNFNPTRAQMIGVDGVRKFITYGWEPDAPVITPKTQITAFGSCFASNISNWLSRRNFRVLTKEDSAKAAYVVAFGEGMVNSFVIRQQFEWAWENKVFDQALWHGYKAEEYGYDPVVQAETKRIFDETEVFILTFGLSEVWYDEPTGNVFWRTIPKDAYDPERHKFRVSTVEENRDNLEAIYALIRKHRPDAKVIFTLSPIPLIATFRDNACLTSNSVSKSVLRVAIDECIRAHQDEGVLFYWPSYELITDIFRLPYRSDRRHPEKPTLDFIMTLFEHVWCTGGTGEKSSLLEAWVLALCSAGHLPASLARVVKNRRPWRLRQFYSSEEPINDCPKTDAAIREMLADLRAEWLADREAAEETDEPESSVTA
ncbi:MAG: GSCFA domain-containing protein [Pseudomonadota bacterium]